MSAALEKRQPDALDMLVTPEWPRAVLELVMRAKCPRGIEPDAFYLFMKQCQVSGMNPLIDQAHCVERRTNVGTKDSPKWVTQHVFQPTIAGMRARAMRFPDFLGLESAPVFEGDVFEMDRGAGAVKHISKPFGNGKLLGAWAKVTLKGRQPILADVAMGARPQIGPVWAQDPRGMLTKCAEALALRKAYAEAFPGYTSEEMAGANEDARVAQLLSVASAVEAAAPAKPTGPVVEFGDSHGMPFLALSRSQAETILEAGEAKYAEATAGERKPKWAPKLRANLDALAAHLATMSPTLPADTQVHEQVETTAEYVSPDPTDEQFDEERRKRGGA